MIARGHALGALKRAAPLGALLPLALAHAAPALAQDRTEAPEQIGAGEAADPTGAAQIGAAPPPGQRIEQLAPTGRRPATDQISRPGGGLSRAPVQLTGERATAASGPQLSREAPTAAGVAPLSSSAQSAPSRVVRLTGRDRCDPARETATRAVACARVIETRSAEFQRPDPLVLTPEQRLLIEQRLREGGGDTRTAARRADVTALDPDDPDSQSIATIALARPGAAAPRDDEQEDEAAADLQAVAEAVAAGIITLQPPR